MNPKASAKYHAIWKFHLPRRKLIGMSRINLSLLGISVIVVSLAGARSSSRTVETAATTWSRAAVQELYGAPVSEVYRTPQNLRVTASFASNGNLCRAAVAPDSDSGISDAQLKPVLDQLVPEKVRGEFKMGTFLDVTCLKLAKPENAGSRSTHRPELVIDPCKECSGVSDAYEHVNITKYGNTNEYTSVLIAFRQAECKELDGSSDKSPKSCCSTGGPD